MKLLAIRLGYQKTIAKSLVMSGVVGFGMTMTLSFRPRRKTFVRAPEGEILRSLP